jgi:hypothetical protein
MKPIHLSRDREGLVSGRDAIRSIHLFVGAERERRNTAYQLW